MFDLSGKTALVTGASGGIGGAIARALHTQHATVAVSGTRREALDQLARELGERTQVLPCNLADPQDVETLVPRTEEVLGRIDMKEMNSWIEIDRRSAPQMIRAIDGKNYKGRRIRMNDANSK